VYWTYIERARINEIWGLSDGVGKKVSFVR
jgi:hypothetical protein